MHSGQTKRFRFLRILQERRDLSVEQLKWREIDINFHYGYITCKKIRMILFRSKKCPKI